MMAGACNLSTPEAEAGEETLSQLVLLGYTASSKPAWAT
jgi:hypothetical protein